MRNLTFLTKNLLNRKILYNVNKVRNPKKKVLMVYLVEPFLIGRNDPKFRRHLNRERNLLIVDVFTKYGYSVDVIKFNDIKTAQKISREYDILFGLGIAFEYLVKKDKSKFHKIIYFATGAPANYQNKKEKDRLEYFNKRYGCELGLRREVKENKNILEDVDNLLILGTKYSRELYKAISSVPSEVIKGHIAEGEDFYIPEKDFSQSKKKFLFLTGAGKILCALDLLLEVFFKNPEWELYVCGNYIGEEGFIDVFDQRIEKSENIHLVEWVDTQGEKFRDLVKQCSSIIMPVTSGAANGSALIGMSHGLIPIISKDCNIQTKGYGIVFDKISEKSIEDSIEEFLRKTPKWYKSQSIGVYNLTHQEYSQENFIKELDKIFTKWNI
jgi:hypothetical protein